MDEKKERILFVWLPIGIVIGIILTLILQGITKANAAQEPQYIFYVNDTLYGTNTQRDIWVYSAGVLDQSNVVYSYGPANAVQTVYTKVNGTWRESEAPMHLQSTVNFTMVKGTFSYTNYEPEYVDEHFIPVTFDTTYTPKVLNAPCIECAASDAFYNVVYFQDYRSMRWYCYAHNGEIRFCNDNIILCQPSGALWYWETEDDLGDRWVLLDTSHVASQSTHYLVYRAMWVTYARGNNLIAVTDYSSSTVPSWPPTHGGGHSFNDGYVAPISSFGYDDTCTIDYLQCTFADAGEEPTPGPVTSDPEFSFFVKGKPFWPQTLVPNTTSSQNNQYYLVDVFASDIYEPLNIQFQGNTALAKAMSEYGVAPPWVRPAVVKSYNQNDLALYIYFSGNLYGLKIYVIGEVLPTHNMEFIRENYDAIEWDVNTEYSSSFYAGTDNGLNCVSIFLSGSVQWGTSETPSLFDITLSRYGSVEVPNRPFYNATNSSCFNYTYNSVDNAIVQGYRIGLDLSPESDITPTPSPEPTLPPGVTPSPVPTEPPHVIIQWPTNTPTPSPVINWTPPGNKDDDLKGDETKNIFTTGLNWFRSNMNNGLLAKAFSFVPPELQWLVWFLIFALLVLAVIRLLIHFGG